MMKEISIELLTDQSNGAVVRLPERQFPGIVIQGDTLSRFVSDLQEIRERAEATNDPELKESIQALHEDLSAHLDRYERALRAHELDRPYASTAQADLPGAPR